MPKISPKNIAQAIYESIDGKPKAEVDAILARSVKILGKRRMLNKPGEILKALQDILDKKTKTVRAKIISAKTLEREEKNRLEEEIKKKYHASAVESIFFENSDLLGGVRVEVGDEVLDNTYKDKLTKLERFLIKKN